MQINFQGNFINKATIQKLNNNYRYETEDVSLVELDPKDKNDIDTLEDLNNNWPDCFANTIFEEAQFENNIKIYTITKQKHNFKKLKPEDILCLGECEYLSKDTLYLRYLQTNPQYIYKMENVQQEYKHIGKSFLNCLKSFPNIDSITLKSLKGTEEFYKNNQFVEIPNSKKLYKWEKK